MAKLDGEDTYALDDGEGVPKVRERVAFRSSPPPTGEEELARFKKLQESLTERWMRLREIDAGPRDVVVIPSMSLDGFEMSSIPGFGYYEERMLFTVMLLRHPRARLVYVTSMPVHPAALEYQIALLTGIPTAHVRERLTMLACYDASARPLTDKILERPRLVHRIRRAIDPERAHMVCFNVTPRERSLAVQLGIPLYGVDPALSQLGTKSGSRQIFRKAGVSFPRGREELRTKEDVAEAISELWEECGTGLRKAVVKHDEGFSGEGNAVLDLDSIPEVAPGRATHQSRTARVLDHLMTSLKCVAKHESSVHFLDGMKRQGGVVEEFVEGVVKRSPSAQLRINPRGELEAMSTHDQILGPDGQTYEGCRFPADPAYRMAIQADAMRIGDALRREGVMGRIAVDFVTVERAAGQWEHFAIENNLRMSGTTHPLMTMQMLNGGKYDPKSGLYLTRRGEARYYVATDSLVHEAYKGLLVEDLLDIAAVHGLHYRPWTDSGVVFHLTGALSQFGKVGLVAMGSSAEEAQSWFEATREALDRETGAVRTMEP